MTPSRVERLDGLLPAGSGTRRFCAVAAEVTAATGAGITLFRDGLPQGSLCTTDPVAHRIEDLQYTLGEGPSLDALRSGQAVLEADLAWPESRRWPVFGPQAVAAGACAIFAFPLLIGAVRLGALDLYRDRPGALSDEEVADASAIADIVARAILALQAEAAPGTVAPALEAGSNFQLVVHQAAGMISVQLDVKVEEALVRLRAHAFSTDRLIADVARDVVSRRLRFDDPTLR